jgi:hypothetical protein
MIYRTKLTIMVDKSLRRRYESAGGSERPFIEMDMQEGAEAEKDRICILLLQEIPGLEAREAHDGGLSLKTLIDELIEKIRKPSF